MTDQPPGRPRPFLLRHAALWLVPLSVIVALLLLEGALRLFPSLLPAEAQLKQLWQEQTPVKSVGDPYLGFIYPPHYKAEIASNDFRFTLDSDEHGFRNASPWPDRAEVVVVGDSMAYGWGVEQRESWTTLLDAALPASRVITLGLPGTTPQQYARYFEKFGVALRPKIVIFAIFPGNDIIDAAVFNRWVAAGSPGNYNVWRFFEGSVPSTAKPLFDRSVLLLSLSSMRKSLLYGFNSRTVTLADGGKLQLVPSVYGKALEHNDPADGGFQSIVKATVDARNRARAIGSQFVVLLFPVKESIYLPLQGISFAGLVHPLQEVLLNQAGIPSIDMTGPFREWAAKGKQLYFEVDGHPNALGNQVVADTVAQYLRANAKAIGLDDWDTGTTQTDLARPR